ncbi:hypothetical protein IWW48_000234 [Coemansia sp. RSA 1200]|nr:hypothetical protein IWW48_000234 [Coemansia sp. RSA 1200]
MNSAVDSFSVEAIPLDSLDWTYSGEGNANILFAYTGTDPKLRGWMLRLLKCSCADNRPTVSVEQKQILEQANAKWLQERMLYTTKVIGSLIGDEYILPQRQAAVTSTFLCQLNAVSEHHRPKYRLDKQIDVDQTTAILTRNGHQVSSVQNAHSITVEIKPKWGFLPTSRFIAENMATSKRVCHFCMKQHSQADIDQNGIFCSLDLFSGDHARVSHAVDCLALSKHCKLRIFVDGHPISSDHNALDTSKVPEWDRLKETVVEIVATDKLFGRLKHLQGQLDQFDIEGIFPMFQRALAEGRVSTMDPSIDEWLLAVSKFNGRSAKSDTVEAIDEKQAILEFMISTTLKDVSVLINMKQWPPLLQKSCSRALPEYSIAVIDADVKHIAKIPKYLQKKQTLVASYLQRNSDPLKQRQCRE